MPKKRTYRVKTDKKLSSPLQEQIGSLRGGMLDAAERVPLPVRFSVEPHPDKPRMTITDSLTGRAVCVGLCDYFAAREVLGALFPDVEPYD